jgi:hypothetical protein
MEHGKPIFLHMKVLRAHIDDAFYPKTWRISYQTKRKERKAVSSLTTSDIP